jgi:hydroxymethylbilane synthase
VFAGSITLAAAGVDRLGRTDWVRERLSPSEFCPAAGQGALGIETRNNDAATIDAVSFLDHADTRFAVAVERAALAALGGGCQVPIGIHCRMKAMESGEDTSETLPRDEVFAVVASPTSGATVRVYHKAVRETNDPESLGRLVAKMLLEAGAGPLLAAHGEAPAGAAQ